MASIGNEMKILVIGNGFDLAHGLPTRYTDFLAFIRFMLQYEDRRGRKCSYRREFRDISKRLIFLNDLNAEDIFNNAHSLGWSIQDESDNLWLKHFVDQKQQENKNWIDFEAEISKIIQDLELWIEYRRTYKNLSYDDQSIPELERRKIHNLINTVYNPFFFPEQKARQYEDKEVQTITLVNDFEVLLRKMEEDLDSLISHLEIYLLVMMQNIDKIKKLCFIRNTNFDYLLSFNYTKTYEEFYRKRGTMIYQYIHGVIDDKTDNNNMVLGIEEYLKGDYRNTNRTFIWFKKYFQRIYKKTGSDYKEWLDIAEKLKQGVEVYIVGHSLAITDKDIFQELIMKSKKTTVYYFDKVALKNLIANMVEIIGQDNLIEKTSDGSLIFLEQPNKLEE